MTSDPTPPIGSTWHPARLVIDDGVAEIVMGNPPVNALTPALVERLHALLGEAEARAARVLIVASDLPGCFGAGGDIRFFQSAMPQQFDEYLTAVRRLVEAVAAVAVPTMACVDGLALGGGLELALACDLRLLGPAARLGLPEVQLGLLPGAGGTQRLTYLVGRQRALDLMLSGREVDRDTAVAWGIGEPSSNARDDARRWAAMVAAHPTEAVAAIRRCVQAALDDRTDGPSTEVEEVRRLFRSPLTRRLIEEFVRTRASSPPSRPPYVS